jgi:hypothetical protein
MAESASLDNPGRQFFIELMFILLDLQEYGNTLP